MVGNEAGDSRKLLKMDASDGAILKGWEHNNGADESFPFLSCVWAWKCIRTRLVYFACLGQ
jgi:hypothetical protein